MKYLCIIQARLGSTRFPGKVLQTVGGVPMVKRVWDAAKRCSKINKVIVAWPERYPDVDENDVRERFQRIIKEFKPKFVIRLTADCPLITTEDIEDVIEDFELGIFAYLCNYKDGRDVQIFRADFPMPNREHLFNDVSPSTGLSVNTKEDLERVRALCV